ncbi:Embryo-specific protein 3, (ATS3) [Musa troglodytarum]|uniref:Embryo-specific protein 3, (ATS3) n=1 Tax=Musa troglodytarum TaxID=320322 RepID=A0A9E7JP76_9LILI|nr:Embryo-specific protein 3, (ATS3) [Musa troglodytarum]
MGPSHDYYERGALDAFSGRGPCGLAAPLCRLNLTSDGAGPHHGWFCDYVEVTPRGPTPHAHRHSSMSASGSPPTYRPTASTPPSTAATSPKPPPCRPTAALWSAMAAPRPHHPPRKRVPVMADGDAMPLVWRWRSPRNNHRSLRCSPFELEGWFFFSFSFNFNFRRKSDWKKEVITNNKYQ